MVVAEFKNQAPIVMEREAPFTSYDEVRQSTARLDRDPRCLRWCVATLTYEGGNALLLHDLKRMQK